MVSNRSFQPFEKFQWDLQGALSPTFSAGHRYIITGICPAIRFPIARPLLTKTKEEVTEARVEIMLEAGVVSLIHLSDMGKEFDNHLALELESLLGGRHAFGLAWTPRFDSIVESSHKALSAFLCIWCRVLLDSARGEWHRLLRLAVYQIWHTPITPDGLTPFCLKHGWFTASPLERSLQPWTEVPEEMPMDEWVKKIVSHFRRFSASYSLHCFQNEEDYSRLFNHGRRPSVLQPGELVLHRKQFREKGVSAALSLKNEGVFEVVSQPSTTTATVQRIEGEGRLPSIPFRCPAWFGFLSGSELGCVPIRLRRDVRQPWVPFGDSQLSRRRRLRWSRPSCPSWSPIECRGLLPRRRSFLDE